MSAGPSLAGAASTFVWLTKPTLRIRHVYRNVPSGHCLCVGPCAVSGSAALCKLASVLVLVVATVAVVLMKTMPKVAAATAFDSS